MIANRRSDPPPAKQNPRHMESHQALQGQNVTRPDLKKQVLESMKIFCKVGGHENAAVYEETMQ
jgi:hypothetical protein